MLPWKSSSFSDYLSRSPYCRLDFSSNTALQTADDFALARSFCDPSKHVSLAPQLITQSAHNDSTKSGVGLSVTTTV